MVRSYDDPIKAVARERFRSFLEETVMRARKPEDVRVLCFPGAEYEGEEALEVRQVYDPLGIPRENIVGLEYNKESAARLERAGLGIDVRCMDVLPYVQGDCGRFDIISLDYTGQLTDKEDLVARTIAGRQVLRSHGVFCANHMIQREGKPMQRRLSRNAYAFQNPYPFSEMGFSVSEEETHKKYLQQYETFLASVEKKEISLDELRQSITDVYVFYFMKGRFSLSPTHALLLKETEKRNPGILKGLSDVELYVANQRLAAQALGDLRRGGHTAKDADYLLLAQRGKAEGWSFLHKGLRLTYVSNKNCRMLTNMFQITPIPSEAVSIAERFLSFRRISYLKPPSPTKKKILLNRLEQLMQKSTWMNDEPIDLGSSWVPLQRKKTKESLEALTMHDDTAQEPSTQVVEQTPHLQTISRRDAIDLLQTGFSAEDIMQDYSGIEEMREANKNFRRQLAALQAHYVTMGKKLLCE